MKNTDRILKITLLFTLVTFSTGAITLTSILFKVVNSTTLNKTLSEKRRRIAVLNERIEELQGLNIQVEKAIEQKLKRGEVSKSLVTAIQRCMKPTDNELGL